MPSSAGHNARRRKRLGEAQDWKCHYCKCEVPHTFSGPLESRPVIEHYTPRSAGGIGEKIKLVLACHWCDKHKGMLHGNEFEEIIKEFSAEFPFNMQAKTKIANKCKMINIERHKTHIPPTKINSSVKGWKDSWGSPIIYRLPKVQLGPKMAELFPRIKDAGDLARENYIAEWEVNKRKPFSEMKPSERLQLAWDNRVKTND